VPSARYRGWSGKRVCTRTCAAWPAPARRAPATCISNANSRSGARKSARDQLGVGVQHAHDRYPLKVVPLGDHLRADQHVELARVGPVAACPAPRSAGARCRGRAARIRTAGQRCRNVSRKRLFDPLACPARPPSDPGCRRSGRARRHRAAPAAMVTAQRRSGRRLRRGERAACRRCSSDSPTASRRHRTPSNRCINRAGLMKHQRLPPRAPSAWPRAARQRLADAPAAACTPRTSTVRTRDAPGASAGRPARRERAARSRGAVEGAAACSGRLAPGATIPADGVADPSTTGRAPPAGPA